MHKFFFKKSERGSFQLQKNIIFVEHLVPYFRYDIFVLDRHSSEKPLGLIENSNLSHYLRGGPKRGERTNQIL